MKFFSNAISQNLLKLRCNRGKTWAATLLFTILLFSEGAIACSDQTAIAPAPSIAQAPSPSPSPSPGSIAALEQAIHTQINQHRRDQGLPPLTLDPRISEQARLHSQAMASGQVTFGHDGFDQRASAIRRSIAWNSIAENVATNQGYSTPDRQAVIGWLNSSGHRRNIEGQYNLTGIGIVRNRQGQYYFTQIFVRSR